MKQCEVCGKGSVVRGTRIKLRGNYNLTNRSRKYPNLQKTVLADGKKGIACTRCIKKKAK